MSDKMLNIGIVGCGTISGTHAEAIAATKNGKLVAVHSRNQSKIDAFSEKYEVRGYTDYDEFLAQSDIDVISICTPSGTHLDYGAKAAKAGKHVIIEKPIEVSLSRGNELINSCRENNVKLAVIYQSRFMDDVNKMKKAIEDGEIGDVFMVSASVKWFRDEDYYKNAPWRGTLKLDGGGAVINQAIHTVDLIQWLAGDVESLCALKGTFTHEGMEGEDNAVASIKFKNGAIGVFQASTSIVPPKDRKVEVHGSKGTALLEGDRFQLLTSEESSEAKDKAENTKAAGAASPLSGMVAENHKKQYDQILDAIENDLEPIVSGNDSLDSLAFVEALYHSADIHAPVNLAEFKARAK